MRHNYCHFTNSWKLLYKPSTALIFLSVVVQSLSHAQLFVIPWTATCQPSLSFIMSQRFLKLMSIESVMLSNHLILCRPLLFLPSIFPSIRVFSNQSALRIRWPKYWSFSFSISPTNEHLGLMCIIGVVHFYYFYSRPVVLSRRQFCPPGDTWPCLETFLVVTTCGGGDPAGI